MIKVLYLCLLIMQIQSISNECQIKNDEMTIIATKNEIFNWNLKKTFFEGENLIYTLSDTQQTQFKIINPIFQSGADQKHKYDSTNLIASKANQILKNGVWTNHFIFLDQTDEKVYINIAEGNDSSTSPLFNIRYEVIKNRLNKQITCYDLEYLDTQLFIVDCQQKIQKDETFDLINIYYIIDKNGIITEIQENGISQVYKERFLTIYQQENTIGKIYKYLLRITPSYSFTLDQELYNDGLVEVYLIQNGVPINTNYVLDKASLAFALGQPTIDFSLVDYQMFPNGDIYLLDAFNGIYIINYLSNGEWLIKDRIDPKIGQSYAFGLNELIKSDGSLVQTIVVQGFNFFVLIEDKQLTHVYDVAFTQLDYPGYIAISQENVLVKSQNILYQYNIDSESAQLNTQLTISQKDLFLLNPYLPDLIRISQTTSSRYTLSEGYFRYIGSTKTQELSSIYLIATTQNQQQCKVKINYQILEDNDTSIFKLKDKVFPHSLTEDTNKSQLQQLASGPSLQYNLQNNLHQSNAQIDIQNIWTLNLQQLIWPTNVIYQDILVLSDQTKFYQIFQTNDLNLQIWLCEYPSIYNNQAYCILIVEKLKLESQITKHTFAIWRHDEQNIYFIYLDSKFSLTMKYYYQGTLKTFKQITFDSKLESNQIKSIYFGGANIFIIKSDYTILAYETYDQEVNPLAIIDSTSFLDYGYDGNWKPNKIYGNRKLHQNLLFIVNSDNFIVVDFHYQFTYIQYFTFNEQNQIEISIAENTFFVVQLLYTNTNQGTIDEYSFTRINNIIKSKTLQLYHYQLQYPLTVDQCEQNGYMFVRALCTKCNKTFILVFKPNTQMHDTLYTAFAISDTNIPDEQSIQIATDGEDSMFLYVNVPGEQQQLKVILTNPIMIITPIINQEEFLTNIDLTLQISNDFNNNILEITQNVQFINTQTKIIIDQTYFSPAKNGITINSNIKNKSVQLGNSWYKGQISNFGLDCEQCETNISLKNVIELTNSRLFNGYEIRDQIKYNEKYNILQATKGLLFINQDESLAAIYDFDMPSATYNCYNAVISEDQMVIYSLCNDGKEYTIYATGCFSVTGCSPLGEKFKLGQAAKIQFIGNEILVVLHTDALSPQNYLDATIVIYNIQSSISSWSLKVLDTITLNTLNMILQESINDFQPADFQIIKQYSNDDSTNIYKLFISDSINGLIFYDFQIKNQNRFTFLNAEFLNLYNYFNYETQLYTLEQTNYLQFKFLSTPIYDETLQILQTQLIIQTSDAAHYGLKIVFQKNNQIQATNLIEKNILFVVNRYGNWPSLNKLAYQNNLLMIPYLNQDKIIIGVYKIDNSKTSITTPFTIIGSYNIFIGDGQIVNPLNIPLFASETQQNKLFFSQFVGPLQSYEVSDSPIIILNNEDNNLIDQTLTLIATNDFGTTQIEFQLYLSTIDLNECSTKIQEIQIYPSVGELIQWSLTQVIFDGVSLQYAVENQNDFIILQPIFSIGDGIQHINSATQIVQFKALLSKNRSWLNVFSFLNKNENTYSLYLTEKTKLNLVPSFSKQIVIKKNSANLICLDYIFLSETQFILDCQENENTIFIYRNGDEELQYNQIALNNLQRNVEIYQIENNKYLIQIIKAINQNGELDNNSYVQLYSFDEDQPILISTLNKDKLKELLKQDIDTLQIVDFKITNEGQLILLDSFNGIYILKYINDWILIRSINVKMSQAFAFDYNNETFTILGFNYFIIMNNDSQPLYIQDVQFNTIKYPQSIKLSEQFIFVQDETQLYLYHFNEQTISLIEIIQLPQDFLINQQDLVTISLTQSNRFTFSQGLLKFIGNKQTEEVQTLKITATSQNNQICTSLIRYNIIDSLSQTIYPTITNNLIPDLSSELNEQFQLGDLASGPNLKYELIRSKSEGFLEYLNGIESDLSAIIIQNLNVDVQDWPKTPLFQVSLVGNDQETLYQVFQNKDKKLQLLTCILIPHTNYVCNDSGSITLQTELNDQLFSIYIGDDQLINIITIDSNYEIKFYFVKDNKLNVKKTITFDKQDGNEIISLLNQGTYLFILQKNGNISNILINDDSTNIINQVNGDNLNGFDADWNPIQLYGNRILRQNVIFIINNNNVAIVNYLNDFECVEIIGFDEENEVKIANSQKTFFLLKDQELLEYNYENLNSIYQSKTVELFGYQIILPLIAQQELNSGIFVIRVNKNEQTYLNYYKPSQLQHDTFFTSIQIGTKFTNEFLLSVAGSVGNSAYVTTFVNCEQFQQMNLALQNPQLIIIPNKTLDTYIISFNMQLLIYNDSDEKLELSHRIKVINTQTHLSLAADQLNQIELKQGTSSFLTLNTTFVQGQFLSSELTQEIKSDYITFQPFIQQIGKTYLGNYKINDAAPFLTYTVLQASNTLLFLIDDEQMHYSQAQFNLPNNYNCFRVQTYKNTIYSLCDTGFYDALLISTCDEKFVCQLWGIQVNFEIATQIIPIQENIVIVLTTYSTEPENYDGYIQFVTFYTSVNNDKSFTISKKITSKLLQNITKNDLRPSSIQVVETGSDDISNYYKLIICDSYNGLIFIDLEITKEDQQIEFLQMSQQLLTKWLNDNGQYATASTIYQQIKVIKSVLNGKDLTVQLIITTNNSSQYLLQLQFTNYQLTNISVLLAFNRYGTWNVINHIEATSELLIVPYYKNNKVSVGVYYIPHQLQGQAVTMQGGYKFEGSNNPRETLLYKIINSLIIIGNYQQQNGIQIYYKNNQQVLLFQDKDNVKNQTLTLTFSNDYSKASKSINFIIIPADVENSSFGLVWILLTLLASLLALIGLGFFYYKVQKPKVEDESLI